MLWAVPDPAVFHSVGVQAVKCSRGGIDRQRGKKRRETVKHGVRHNMHRS